MRVPRPPQSRNNTNNYIIYYRHLIVRLNEYFMSNLYLPNKTHYNEHIDTRTRFLSYDILISLQGRRIVQVVDTVWIPSVSSGLLESLRLLFFKIKIKKCPSVDNFFTGNLAPIVNSDDGFW